MIALCLCALCMTAFREWRVRPDGKAHVHMLDVGQGDAIFITSPSGKQILIDGGPDLSALSGIGKRMSFFDRSIDLLVLSHPHRDHLFALPALLKRHRIAAVLFTGVSYPQAQYREMLEIVMAQNIPVIIADPARDLDMGDGLTIDVLWPPPIYVGKEDESGGNDSSVVLKLVFGEDSMLFTGDMELPEERAAIASGADLRADILKVAHHGSKTSTSTGFLLAVDPDLALISAGRDNSFGHPHTVVLERLDRFSVPYRTTAGEGVIEVEMDGRL